MSLSDSNVTGKEVRKSTGPSDGYGLEKGGEEEEEEGERERRRERDREGGRREQQRS